MSERDRPAEIEITPAMMEAGAAAARDHTLVLDQPRESLSPELQAGILAAIYQAMDRARADP